MKSLQAVTAQREYEVLVGRGCLAAFGAEWRKRCPGGRVVVCSDQNVAPLYGRTVAGSLAAADYDVSEITIPPGEAQKSLSRAEELYGVFYDRSLRRGDTVVALGGGVMGDLAGFVAATYQRGVRLVQVPTTLLAQVDASAGGKVAVDYRAGKNYVGTFYQPWLVFVDLDTLRTLPARELRSGAAEVAKHGLLVGGRLLELTEALDSGPGGPRADAVGEDLVAGNIAYKIEVVAADEREETGARAVLNLGHTIGHAIEAATAFSRYTHGEAVGLGLRGALRLSERLCGLDSAEAERGQVLLDRLGLPGRLEGASPAEVCALIARDKKAAVDGVDYVLLESLGRPRLGARVPADLELEVVEWLTVR